eukprot:1580887-Pleurochrysis_carterae.AAC.1
MERTVSPDAVALSLTSPAALGALAAVLHTAATDEDAGLPATYAAALIARTLADANGVHVAWRHGVWIRALAKQVRAASQTDFNKRVVAEPVSSSICPQCLSRLTWQHCISFQ